MFLNISLIFKKKNINEFKIKRRKKIDIYNLKNNILFLDLYVK
jgi:hypothetical protein